MAYAIGMAQHRDLGVLLDEPDELVRSPRDDEVHVLVQGKEPVYLLPGGQQLHGRGEPLVKVGHGLDDDLGQGLVRAAGLGAALEYHSVPGLEA